MIHEAGKVLYGGPNGLLPIISDDFLEASAEEKRKGRVLSAQAFILA